MSQLPLPLVCTTIPCHNKADTIARAIQSVQRQTLNNLVCYVINDASTDDSERVILETIKGDARFHYKKVEFRNVARVRNLGASLSDSPFINFLDGDDWMEDTFLEVCIQPLLKDPSLGVTYTSLRWHKLDGSTGISQWPGEFNYDNQLRKQNQCPTCSVIRRGCWERLGGQNPKYSVLGAGAEDAEWYLRMGAYGWSGKKATDSALFNYSWQSGIVSGNPNYQEPPWLDAHPWTQDRLHPFASVATPKKLSHPVRQYDEPTVSVIIPVGPGHEEKVKDALNSLEAQAFRGWEAIVIFDTGNQYYPDFFTAYPYVRALFTDRQGPGYARNRGAEIARAPFLLFLDADDELYPTHIERHLKAWKDHQAIVYSDYVGKAVVENPADLDPVLQERLYHHNERTGEVVIGHRAADYDCERAQVQPQGQPPYLWCNVTALVPKTWHDEIGGFDESMPSWEDVDYHWRLAKAGHCYHRIEEELMVYRFHTGHRRERGRQDHKNLLQYLAGKHERIEAVPCSGCGGSRNRGQARAQSAPVQKARQVEAMRDDDFVRVQYVGKRGNHQLTGGFVFSQQIPGMRMINKGRGGWAINYGRQSGGNVLLVHRADIQAMPGRFIPIPEDFADTAPPPVKEPLPIPEPVTGAPEAPPTEDIIERDFTPPSIDWQQNVAAGVDAMTEPPFDFQRIPGVGPALARQFSERGLTTKREVLALGVEGLTAFRGVAEAKAAVIIKVLEDAD